MIKLTL